MSAAAERTAAAIERRRNATDQAASLRGLWIGASYLLGRPVPVADLYPHVCQLGADGLMTPDTWVKLRRLDCGACMGTANLRPVPGEITAEQRAVQARMLGEREDNE